MQQNRVLAFVAVFGVCCSLASLTAVGFTTRVTIEGDSLDVPIVIRDPATTAQFFVWGTFMIDLASGPVAERPTGLHRYKVSFFVNHRTDPAGVESLAYVVFYEYDPSTGRGFVYLPGKADEEWTLNVFSIYRRVEGNWFRPTITWERHVNPLIDQALSR